MTGPSAIAKTALRRELLSRRRARPETERQAARLALTDLLRASLRGTRTVAGYLPLASEPMSRSLLDQLRSDGIQVLVPRVAADQPLDWCAYDGTSRPGRWGIDEPVGEPLGPSAIRNADAILVPALAIDRNGHRLGRGGGHYDRTLADPLLPPDQSWIAVIFDDEWIPRVPHDPLDVPVRAVATPNGGVVSLGM